MKLNFFLNRQEPRRGMALIIVISALALISILVVAIFSVTRREYKATQSYVSARSAKQLGDLAVAIVEAQIQNAQWSSVSGNNTGTQRTTHATQPGMVRQYSANGDILNAYKLYSSAQMKVNFGGGGTESSLLSPPHVAPTGWENQPARYVDLNDPVVRPGAASTAGASTGYSVYYPIIDPRAFWNTGAGGQDAYLNENRGTTQVEGFSYSASFETPGGSQVNYSSRVRTPTQVSNPADLRLPMPVEWMYVLQDGSLGVLNGENDFVGSTAATAANPIVGRVAFWTDDESCKINVNTASEPTYSAPPHYFHERDMRWAHYPPATGEYQRYPGHPATVALSTVLAPFYLLDPLNPQQDSLSSQKSVVDIKEQIYLLMPKVEVGGSKAGTLPFVSDEVLNEGATATFIKLDTAQNERLFASVDEMLFKDGAYSTGTGRVAARFTLPNGQVMFNHDVIERSRFFLTAHSRSPEFSIHGLPRIAMWPVADESLGAERRSTFDNMIALTGTIKGKSGNHTYFVRRAASESGAHDVTGNVAGFDGSTTLTRNQKLLNYLGEVLNNLQYPATAPTQNGQSGSFATKYGSQNAYQLAVQFFDYIRSTNLYDGVMARKNDAWSTRNSYSNQGAAAPYMQREQHIKDKYTYTSPRISMPPTELERVNVQQGDKNTRTDEEGTLPGHGQVSPAQWQAPDGNTYKGLGRMLTISEIGFQFICTASGTNDDGATASLGHFGANGASNFGGGTAPRFDPTITEVNGDVPGQVFITPALAYPNMDVRPLNGNEQGYLGARTCWFSNFPPLTPAGIGNAMAMYGCRADIPEFHPSRHPAFNPANWNMTLAEDTALQPGQKRIQMMFLLEFFCPSLGWTAFNPEWTVELKGAGISGMTLEGQPLFSSTQNFPIKSANNVYRTNAVHAVGGHVGPSGITGGRHGRGISLGGGNVRLPSDPNFNTTLAGKHTALQNYTFISDFVTINDGQSMSVTFPTGNLEIWLYDSHDTDREPVQKFYIQTSGLPTQIPVPHLVGSSSPIKTSNGDSFLYLDNNNRVNGQGGNRYNGGRTTPWKFETMDNFGRLTRWRSYQAPHYWCGNYRGALGVLSGRFNAQYGMAGDMDPWGAGGGGSPPVLNNYTPYGQDDNPNLQMTRGRLDNREHYSEATGDGSYRQVPITPDGFSDVIVSMVPTVADYRIVAAKPVVTDDMWMPHPLTKVGPGIRQAHSFTGYWANYEPGAYFGVNMTSDLDWLNKTYDQMYDSTRQLVGGVRYDMTSSGGVSSTQSSHHPDFPPDADWATVANAYGDFDTGISDARIGPYINKPDEGNFFASNETLGNVTKYFRSAYFYESWQNAEDWRSGIYMTPNRMVSSPVMFGSLPTGVYGSAQGFSVPQMSLPYAPWQTLLFRPHAAVSSVSPAAQPTHPGAADPADHYLLDLFYMPVVEPYAISEPLSVAGRINMNYQIMPFQHIRRATGMHALLKGEFMSAIPNEQMVASKSFAPGGSNWDAIKFTKESDGRYWHRQINARATLRQCDLRFAHNSGTSSNSQGLFRSASQICELQLVPRDVNSSSATDVQNLTNATSQAQFDQVMESFWGNNRGTGDNIRERPYSNLYARLTTRSNTFRVHVRSQTIRKARSVAVNKFDPDKDAITGEYRGSTLIERYIDPNDSVDIPDYADDGGPFAGSKMPLDAYYRFRVLETKRFAP